ncbi:MAG: hypothetical protein H6828_10075 [Planctomycetes bacterium]|nr:hypothetical protein [Planctomycetota bacterium]
MNRMPATLDPPATARALVVDRWNSWVQVWFPDTGEREWINLAERGFAPAAPGQPSAREAHGDGERG